MSEERKRLNVIRSQVVRGRLSLETAAKQNADMAFADLGWIPQPQLAPTVNSAVSGMLEGTISEAICTEKGCHLIRLVATRPAGPTPLSDLRDGLVRALRQQKQAELERGYATTLLQKQPVAINEIALSRVAQ